MGSTIRNTLASSSRLAFASKASKSAPSRSASSIASSSPEDATRKEVLELVQRYDYPNYLCTSFYPTQEASHDYIAIRAFNVELSNIADSVRTEQLGRLRFQWWREAIASITSNKPVPHPTVRALHQAFRRSKLSSYHLSRLIDAKERNFISPTYNTLSDLTSYAQSTTLSLLSLQLQVLTSAASRSSSSSSKIAAAKISDIPLSTIDHSLSHLASYISIAQVLRSLYYFAASKRQMVLPRDIASAHGVVDEHVYRALPSLAGKEVKSGTDPKEAFNPVIEACSELVALAELERLKARWTLGLEESQDEEHRELAQGRKLSRLPKEIMPVFLAAVPAKSFLKQFVGQADYNPFHPVVMQQQILKDYMMTLTPLQRLLAAYNLFLEKPKSAAALITTL